MTPSHLRTSAGHAPHGPPGPVPFQHLAVEHGTAVLRVCRALVGTADADDAWSETFLAALRGYPSLPPGANVQAWLVTIAHRKCVDILRSRARAPVPIAEDALAARAGTVGVPGSRDRFAPLWSALARLPLKQRQAVVYHHLVGMPYKEVAQLIGNSPAAARRCGADGIAALRRDPLLGPAPAPAGTAESLPPAHGPASGSAPAGAAGSARAAGARTIDATIPQPTQGAPS